MDALLSDKYVGLYNDAIFKIFSLLRILDPVENSFGLNKMMFPVKKMDDYVQCQLKSRASEALQIIDEECKPLFEQKRFFLQFIQDNFSDLTNQGPQNLAKLQDIVKKVKDFIKNMEVNTPRVIESMPLEIEVTLHDIIGSLDRTSFGSPHCLSEKLFLAILLAIKRKAHVYTLNREYKLTFKFKKSLFGKSGLQKSSVICSSDKNITESTDPVSANSMKTIFNFNTDKLDEAAKAAAKAKAALEAPPDAAPTLVQSEEVLGNEAPQDAAVVDKTTEEENPLEIPPPIVSAETQVEESSATMLGDDLYKNHNGNLPSRDVLASDETIKTYREQILSKYDQFTTTELGKDKICELLLISCNGSKLEQFKKLLFFKEIFASEYCVMSNIKKCYDIFMKLNDEIEKLQSSLYTSVPSVGGSKSRRRHRRKPARKTTRKSKSKSKSKSKPKTHKRRRAHHSRTREHKKYTSRRR